MAISKSKKSMVMMKTGSKCWYCGDCDSGTIDHVVPVSKGGSDEIVNLVACCKVCNSSKKDLDVEEFRYKTAWRKTIYSNAINHIAAMQLIKMGVKFDGFNVDHKFWFEVVF